MKSKLTSKRRKIVPNIIRKMERFRIKGAEKKKVEPQEEPEILEATKELENDTKLNNEMLKLEKEINQLLRGEFK